MPVVVDVAATSILDDSKDVFDGVVLWRIGRDEHSIESFLVTYTRYSSRFVKGHIVHKEVAGTASR